MHIEIPADGHAATDPLLPQACAWIEQLRSSGHAILIYPISRLQRTFRLGYTRTCALAAALAQRGEWCIAYTKDGTRYARLYRHESSTTLV